MVERIGERQSAAHAVAEQEHRHARVAVDGLIDAGVEVGDGIVEAVDERPRSLRAAMAAVIEGVYGKSAFGELPADPVVAPTALGGSVREDDHGSRIRGRQPRLCVQLQSADARKCAFLVSDVVHGLGKLPGGGSGDGGVRAH